MEQNKIVAIQIGVKVDTSKLIKQPSFTTNCDYVGHTKETNIPVYINKKLQEKEIKQIMKSEFKNLKPGTYDCVVRQIINKNGKNEKDEEDPNKKLMVFELDVKGQDNYQYKTFFMEGYSDKQIEISKIQLEKMKKEFGLTIIEEIVGKECKLVSKVNEEGYSHLYLNAKKEFYDWSKVFNFDGQAEFPCEVLKFYKTKTGNKYNFLVKANVNGEEVNEYVCYDLDNEYGNTGFAIVLKKLELQPEDADKDLVDKKAKLSVKRTTKEDKVFFNKKIKFDKPVKEHYWK